MKQIAINLYVGGLLLVLLSLNLSAQEKNDGYRFSMAVDLGVQNFLGRSGISMIDYNQNDFSSMRYNCLLGFNNSKRFFALELLKPNRQLYLIEEKSF